MKYDEYVIKFHPSWKDAKSNVVYLLKHNLIQELDKIKLTNDQAIEAIIDVLKEHLILAMSFQKHFKD